MNKFSTVLGAVLPIFGLMAAGLGLRKLNWLTEEADQSLMRINVNVLLPCLIFDSALDNPALAQMGNLLLAPTVGYVTVVLGIGLALAARALHGLRERPAARTFALCVGIYIYGYIPLPLVLLLFDKNKATTGVLLLVMMGVETALWTLGVWTLTGGSLGQRWRRIINAPLIAIVLALLLNTLGLNAWLPQRCLRAFIGWDNARFRWRSCSSAQLWLITSTNFIPSPDGASSARRCCCAKPYCRSCFC